MENLKSILEASGCSLNDVVLTIVFLRDMKKYGEFNEVYSEYFRTYPARAVVGVNELPAGADVEVLAVAVKPSSISAKEER